MKRIFYIILLLFAFSSCEYEFPIDMGVEDAKLILHSTVNEDSHLVLGLNTATPVDKHSSSSKQKLQLENLSITLNDTPLQMEDYSYANVLGMKYMRSLHSVRSGDVIKIKAKAVGAKEVEAETIVPSKPKVTSVSLDTLRAINNIFGELSLLYMKIGIENINSDDVLMMKIRYIAMTEDEDGSPVAMTRSIVPSDAGKSVIRCPYDGISFMGTSIEDDYFFVPASVIKNGVLEFISDFYFKDFDTNTCIDVYAYKVSDSFYYYGRSLYMQSENFLSELGFSAPNMSYSNVKNGLGVLGAVSEVEVYTLRGNK